MRKNILITGSHRSGSTWVGEILSTAPGTVMVSELFNPRIGKQYSIQWPTWFYAIHDENIDDDVKQKLQYGLGISTSFSRYVKHFVGASNAREKKLVVRRLLSAIKNKLTRKSFLLKDPIAFFSAPYLFEKFGYDVLLLVRHPAAFIASIKKQNWQFDFKNLTGQPWLMERISPQLREDVIECIATEKDVIEQGVVLWNVIHEVLFNYKEQYNWLVVRHEDLTQHPLEQFEKIFDHFQLDFTHSVKRKIETTTSDKNEGEVNYAEGHIATNRNSKKITYLWKERLTASEIIFIKDKTQEVWSKFYSEKDW